MLLRLLGIAILFLQTIKTHTAPENVLVAINCGGDSVKDSNGIHYIAVDFLARISIFPEESLQILDLSLK